MVKVLAQTGMSLADVYDVQGSILGVEDLQVSEVQAVHEMGSTIFAERSGAQLLRIATGDILQSVTWDLLVPGLTSTPMRLLGLTVISTDSTRVRRAQVSISNNAIITAGREMPVFVFDDATDVGKSVRIVENGDAAASMSVLSGSYFQGTPSMLFGDQARRITPAIKFRGSATAFGAGTVECVLLAYVAWAEAAGGLSSKGLPLPSW